MPEYSRKRAGIILALIATVLVGMIVRVAYLQTYGRQKMVPWAERAQHTNLSIVARRGPIWDRNGVAMAGTVQTWAVYIDPKFMLEEYQKPGHSLNQMDEDLRKLASLLEIDSKDLSQVVSEKQDKEYVKVAENLDERISQDVSKLSIPGVGLEPVCVRHYPMGTLAAHVLGSVGAEGRGMEGIELACENILAGKNGFKRLEKDARRRAIGVEAEDYVPPQHGQHLVLTIDASIQMIAEDELERTCTRYKAKCGEVIVMDPQTGEILAMANWPTFNPEDRSPETRDLRRNRCIVTPYEPGSTIKPFIMGPALAWHLTTADHVWPVRNPYITPYGRRVSDVHGYPPLSSWDVLVKSSNVGMALLGEHIGNAKLYQAVTGFGFGRRTGIELKGEDPGLVYPLRQWGRASTESVAQGYELLVTPLQLARAFCAYANGGKLVKPHLIKGTLDADGKVEPRKASTSYEPREVMDEETTLLVRRILADVLVRGTARSARSKYWNIFGKTGTSHIVRPGHRGYDNSLFNSSFVGGAPVEGPRVIVAMVIHEPDRSLGHYGGTVSAPAAARVLERTLAYWQVPQSPQLPPPPASVAAHLFGYNAKQLEATASARD